MKKSQQALEARDAERDIGEELLESVREMMADKRARVHDPVLATATVARHKMNMSQSEFATLLGVSKRTLQDWEQGRREPSGAAQTLIEVAKQHPEVLLKVLRDKAA